MEIEKKNDQPYSIVEQENKKNDEKNNQSINPVKNPDNFTELPNGYSSQKFFDRYIRIEYINSASWTINFLMIIVWFQYEIIESDIKDWLLILSSIFHVLCTFILILCYKVDSDYKKISNRYEQTNKLWKLLFQICVLLLRPFPFLNDINITFESNLLSEDQTPVPIEQIHKLNHILYIFSLIETFVILPIFFINSKYQNPRAKRICSMYGAKATFIYSIKSMFKQNSTSLILTIFTLWIFLCAAAFRISEYQYTHNLKSFQNSVWLTFITVVSVGYGDLYPRTFLGKMIGFIAMYTGVFITSVIVIIINNRFIMNNRQRRSLTILNSLQKKHQLKIIAAQYLKEALWRMWINKKNKLNAIKLNPTLKERKLKDQFRILRNRRNQTCHKSDIKDEFQSNFKKLFGYLDNLNENQQRIANFIHQRNIRLSIA